MLDKHDVLSWKDITVFLGYLPVKLIVSAAVAICCAIFFKEMGISITWWDIQIPAAVAHVTSVYALFISGAISTLFILIAYDDYIIEQFKKFTAHIAENIIIILIGFLMAFVFMEIFKLTISTGAAGNQGKIESILHNSPMQYRLMMYTSTLVFAPIVEEFMLRKVLIGNVLHMNKRIRFFMCIVSAILFGFLHYSINEPILLIIPYMIIGFVLGQVYIQTETIIVPIILHALNNLVASLSFVLIAMMII